MVHGLSFFPLIVFLPSPTFFFSFFLSFFSLIFPSFLSFAFFLPVILSLLSLCLSFISIRLSSFLSSLLSFHLPCLSSFPWKLGLDQWNYKGGGGGTVGPGCVFLYFYLHVTFDRICGTHGRIKLGCGRYLTKEYPYPSEIHRSVPLLWPWCDLMWPSSDLRLFLGFGWQHLRLQRFEQPNV